MKYIGYLLIVIFSSFAQAQYFQMDLMKQRQSNKQSTRWTLIDWMSQKQKIDLWDYWLAMNRSANLFEMQLSASQFDYDLTTESGSGVVKTSESSKFYAVDLWISIFSLGAEYEERDNGIETSSGMLSLRLVGTSQQSTNLIVRGGVRKWEDTVSKEIWQNPFASASLKMYLLSFIGLQGEYRHFFAKNSDLGTRREGSRVRTGAFMEVGIFQVTGNYWKEPSETSTGGVISKQQRQGYDIGLSLIF